MAKPAVRELIRLRKQLDKLEAEVRENHRLTAIAARAALEELRSTPGSERLVKSNGEVWKIHHDPTTGIRVIGQDVDEDVD